MKRLDSRLVLAPLLAACSMAVVHAQRSDLVSVELTDVSGVVAQRIGVDESVMPMSILVAPDVAASVCEVRPAGPGSAQRNSASCKATRSSPELDRIIGARMKMDEPPPEPTRPASQ